MVKVFGKADLHVHTIYSKDAFSRVEAVLKRAREKKLDLIAITDHHTLKGAKEVQKISPQFGIEVILGEEIETKKGEIIALFIKNLILPKKGVLETIREIHQQGGLAIVPHPANWFLGGIPSPVLFQIFDKVDGIELLNGSWAGKIKQREIRELNSSVFNLAAIGASDAHHSRQVGSSYTIFPGKTADDLYQAIKKKLTLPAGFSWDYKDRLLWLINSPRFLYRYPTIFPNALSKVVKKIIFKS